jgi:YggT family protein
MNSAMDVIITSIGEVLSLLIIINALLSFALAPDHPIRQATGRVLEPIYAPIRRVIPPAGMFDFTPIIVLILIQLLVMVLTSIF